MVARGRTNIRAEIDSQYLILTQMINDITNKYTKMYVKTNQLITNEAISLSNGCIEEYQTIINSYSDLEEMNFQLAINARKMLFCYIYSYYEAMLKGLISYFKNLLATSTDKYTKDLYDCIHNFLLKSNIQIPVKINSENLNEFCRLLRNHYIHSGDVKKDLYQCISKENFEYKDYIDFTHDSVTIINDSLLTKTLDIVYACLCLFENALSELSRLKQTT